jgi:hypothetical protein
VVVALAARVSRRVGRLDSAAYVDRFAAQQLKRFEDKNRETCWFGFRSRGMEKRVMRVLESC